jgi:hypothetical protein
LVIAAEPFSPVEESPKRFAGRPRPKAARIDDECGAVFLVAHPVDVPGADFSDVMALAALVLPEGRKIFASRGEITPPCYRFSIGT